MNENSISCLFYSEIEKSITKATSEEKITATRELDITTQRDYKNTTPENDSKITMKEKSKNSKSHMQKRKNKSIVIRSHIEENWGQKNSMRDSSVLTHDEQKSSADIHITNTIPTSIIIKNTKESNRSNTWRTGRLSQNQVKD